MQVERIRHLLVTSTEGWLQGIVTDRDVRLHVPLPELLPRLTVGQVMSTSLVTIGPERDATEAARLMLVHKIGALPVIHGSRPIGIATESDFVRAFAQMATAPPFEPTRSRRCSTLGARWNGSRRPGTGACTS